MKRVRIADLKDHLSEYLRAVENGAEVEVSDRNRPIARVVPIQGRGPRVTVRRASRRFGATDRKIDPRASWAEHALELLLEERGKR